MVNVRQSLYLTTFARAQGGGEVEWRISADPVPYPEAVAEMESRAADIAEHKAAELVWLLEHPPLYTSGTSGKEGDLLDPRFPLFTTGRGGQVTYHGPGQRVAYVMLDLKRAPDVRLCGGLKNGSSARSTPSTWANAARIASASGRRPERAPATQDRRDRRAAARWVSFHGIASMSSRSLRIFPRSCLRRRRPALRRHLAGRSRPARDDGRCRRRTAAGV
jgi:lipoyl(octanoyl) transferase